MVAYSSHINSEMACRKLTSFSNQKQTEPTILSLQANVCQRLILSMWAALETRRLSSAIEQSNVMFMEVRSQLLFEMYHHKIVDVPGLIKDYSRPQEKNITLDVLTDATNISSAAILFKTANSELEIPLHIAASCRVSMASYVTCLSLSEL